MSAMIIWINGTYGAGKSVTAKAVADLVPDARIFDSVQVGALLRGTLGAPETDFQDWVPWRRLVVETAAQILDYAGGTLVMPQTVLNRQYWDEFDSGLAVKRIPVRHFVLHGDRDTLVRRIENDRSTGWRLRHVDVYEEALPWLSQAGELIDTSSSTVAEVAQEIADRVN
jgi:hypothetical protein